MTANVAKIPHPARGEDLVPGTVLAPLGGIDPGRYRLGCGGGFFEILAGSERHWRVSQ